MSLRLRNVDVDPDDPVESWPAEAVRTALERGGLADWHRMAVAIAADPWGPVARRVEEAVTVDPPEGSGPLLAEVLVVVRERALAAERADVAAEIRRLLAASGLTQAQFASRAGTSASRMSTYLRGTVTPSDALIVRMRRVRTESALGVDGADLPCAQTSCSDLS